jgi:signal transduction histidine kinase
LLAYTTDTQPAIPATQNATLALTIREQVTQAKRQIDWHLAKSRAAAAHQQIHEANAVSPMVDSLVRAMRVVHAKKQLNLEWRKPEQHIDFLGAAQDFQEMLGNVLDNACMWAEHTVRISVAQQHSNQLQIMVQDDGPGLSAAHMQQVLQRGVRLDEQQAGSGLGLTITQDLAATYGGQLQLSASALGGLQATLTLPARLAGQPAS